MVTSTPSGNWVAIGRVVVYYAKKAHAFSAGIKCRHCRMYFLTRSQSTQAGDRGKKGLAYRSTGNDSDANIMSASSTRRLGVGLGSGGDGCAVRRIPERK